MTLPLHTGHVKACSQICDLTTVLIVVVIVIDSHDHNNDNNQHCVRDGEWHAVTF